MELIFEAVAYALFNTSASTAKMVQMGLLAHIGAHGEPPLGVNYHAEMAFAKAGGLSNYEVCDMETDVRETIDPDLSGRLFALQRPLGRSHLECSRPLGRCHRGNSLISWSIQQMSIF